MQRYQEELAKLRRRNKVGNKAYDESSMSSSAINGTLYLHRSRSKSSMGTRPATTKAKHLKTSSENKFGQADKMKRSMHSSSSQISSTFLNQSVQGAIIVKKKKTGAKKLRKATNTLSGTNLMGHDKHQIGPKPLIHLVKDRTSD